MASQKIILNSGGTAGVNTAQVNTLINNAIIPIHIDVKEQGAAGNGIADDRADIMEAIEILKTAGGGTIFFPYGTYKVSKYIFVNAAHNITFMGAGGAKILYASDDESVVTDANTLGNPGMARSGFLVKNSDHVKFINLHFEGGNNVNITVNIGNAVYASNSKYLLMQNCYSKNGSSIFHQDILTNDHYAKIIGCDSYGARGNINPGQNTLVEGCTFELPTTSDYDRVGNNGSSHAIYAFAGRNNLQVRNCTFKNIRIDGVKGSGTASTQTNFTVEGCTFEECGTGVLFGADDNQDHASCNVQANNFINCHAGVTILGARLITIAGNNFFYNRDIADPASAISIARYAIASQPVEQVNITNNNIMASLDAGHATTPANVLLKAITVEEVGQGTTQHSAVRIAGNMFKNVGSIGINAVLNLGLVIEDNIFNNCGTAFSLNGNRMPVIRNNRLIAGTFTSSNAQLRLNSDAFPIIYGNVSSGRINASGSSGNGITISSVNTTVVDFPIMGSSGRVRPSESKPEIVFAYGDGWTNGDTVICNSVTYTYQASSPTGNQFNSCSGLIALLNAATGLDADDYGGAWSIITNHIRVRLATTSNSANHFSIRTTTANKTAGVLLGNGNGGVPSDCQSRGEDSGAGSVTVIWSPMAHFTCTLNLLADNATAQTLLKTNGFYVPSAHRTNDNSGSSITVEHGDIAGGEEFRYTLN